MCCSGNGCFGGHDSSTTYLRFLTLRKDMVIHRLSSAAYPPPGITPHYRHLLDMDQQPPTDCIHWLPSRINTALAYFTLLLTLAPSPPSHIPLFVSLFVLFFSCISTPLSRICCTTKGVKEKPVRTLFS